MASRELTIRVNLQDLAEFRRLAATLERIRWIARDAYSAELRLSAIEDVLQRFENGQGPDG